MKAFINILSLLLALAGCTSVPRKEGLSYADFPETRDLSASIQMLDTALFRYPFRVRMHGDKVVVFDLHGTGHFFHLFHYPDFHYLTSFGKRGDSPQEMLSAENIRWDRDGLWALDANSSNIIRFGFSLSGDSLLRQEVVNLDKDILRTLDFVQYDDSTFIIPDYSGDSRFAK